MADDDTDTGPSLSDQFKYLAGVGPQPKTSTKKTKTLQNAPVTADRQPDDNTLSFDPSAPNEDQIAGKDYKFKEVSANPYGNIKDYSARDSGDSLPNEQGPVEGDPDSKINRDLEMALGGVQNSKDLSPHEYAALTKEAQNGNKLAQQILVKGKFKAQDYPTLQQDLNKVEDPFVKALSGMPALAENAQNQMNAQTQPYDFTNAEGQVNSLLGQMGSAQRMSTSPETNTYLSINSQVAKAGNLDSSALGLPSIMGALGGLGPAAKESEKASPYASLLAALLSHQQYETIYGGAAPSSTGDPAWLQSLIASVTGTGITGGLVAPSVAAGGVGTVPSTSATPTGSNG